MSVSVSSSNSEEYATFIAHLPRLSRSDLTTDSCPICLLPWDGIEQQQQQQQQQLIDLESESELELDLSGITKLSECGHTFCRKDLAQWILGGHGSCPICRNVFLSIVAGTASEPESSDDDYIPSSDLGNDADSLYESDWMDADQEWEDEQDADVNVDLNNEEGDFGDEEGEREMDVPLGQTLISAEQDHEEDIPFVGEFWGWYDSDSGV